MTSLPKRCLLLATCLLICHASLCVAILEHICIADWIPSRIGKTPVSVAEALPGTSSYDVTTSPKVNAEGFAPIRIKVIFGNDSCIKYGPHPRAKDTRIRGYYRRSCEESDIVNEDKMDILIHNIIPAAVKLHAERLLVKPANGIKVPNFTKGICAEFKIPEEHIKNGIPDADMVMYLSALPTFGSEHAWAVTCATLDDRPAVGVMNFGPDLIVDSELSVRVAAHAMAHALGFTLDNMKERGMIEERSDVRGKKLVRVVKSDETVKMAKKHYDCPTVSGMELEDEELTQPIPSHWERRNAKDELMSSFTSAGYYTALTLASFRDMGYYRADFSKAESMSWGNASSCDLLEKPCIENGVTKYPEMFCTTPGSYDCTSDRLAVGRCGLIRKNKDIPELYRYFESPLDSGDPMALTDYCPVITPREGYGCVDGDETMLPGSIFGTGSRCLRGKNLEISGKYIPAVCVKVSCNDNTVKILIRGDDTWHHCPEDTMITPSETSFSGGSIVCPRYAEVCTVNVSDE